MKRIFVGSSSRSDAESYANVVCDLIAQIDPQRVKPVHWRDAFPLGLLTFGALERMLRICSGFVLIATPDVEGQPNENVMLEFGLVAGRMGITNVVLCKHPDARVPSDLLSVTYVELKPATDGNGMALSTSSVSSLRQWVLGLPETMEGMPSTQLVHGYTGRWRVFLTFDRWRQVSIGAKSIATMEGILDLIIPPDGQQGFGLAKGDILVHLQAADTEKIPFEARYKVCSEISDVQCLPCGELTLRSHTLSRQRTHVNGSPSPEEGLDDEEVGPWNFSWHMIPDPDNTCFKVTVKTDLVEWTSAKGELRPGSPSIIGIRAAASGG
jgi:hypothetical protein